MHLLSKPVPLHATRWDASPARSDGQTGPGAPPLLKVAGATLDPEAAACPRKCNALPHTELHGRVRFLAANCDRTFR